MWSCSGPFPSKHPGTNDHFSYIPRHICYSQQSTVIFGASKSTTRKHSITGRPTYIWLHVTVPESRHECPALPSRTVASTEYVSTVNHRMISPGAITIHRLPEGTHLNAFTIATKMQAASTKTRVRLLMQDWRTAGDTWSTNQPRTTNHPDDRHNRISFD